MKTSEAAMAAIGAVHAICGPLVSGGLAEGVGSQSGADLGRGSAC